MKKFVSYFRPEELLAFVFLLILGALNLGDWNHRRPLDTIVLAYTESFFIPMASLILISVFAWRRNESIHPIRDWLPFILCLLTYEFLHDFVHWINPHDQDALLESIDFAIFGVHPTVWLERYISPELTDYLSFSYMIYFFYPPALGFILYFNRRYGEFRDAMLAVVIACFAGYIGYLTIPAIGPKYFQQDLYTRALSGGPFGERIILTIDTLKPIARDCFPSLHTAVVTVVLIFAYKHARLFFWGVLPLALSLIFATLYLRYHYFIDLVAGFALAFFAAWAAEKLNRWWYVNIKAIV